MHVIVLGAGLEGVTSAWYLQQAGHTVTVIDRQPAAGLETSFANGGQISASHPEPWASPSTPAQILRWLGRNDAPLLFRPRLDWDQWVWGLRFLFECLPSRSDRNTHSIGQLAVYSRDKLKALRAELALDEASQQSIFDYDCLQKGILHVFFDGHEFAEARHREKRLHGFGMRAEVLDAQGCIAVEPALAYCREKILGGMYAPDDESGDAHRFTQALAARCEERGVTFRYNTQILSLDCDLGSGLSSRGGRVTAVNTLKENERDCIAGDAFLVALGSYSRALVKPLGVTLPIYPVKGYSATIPIAENADMPHVSVTDESHRIVYTRLGNHLRVAGTAELSGYNTLINPERCEAMLQRTRTLFPQLAPTGEIKYWVGLRPATPSNVPIIGRTKHANLYCNTGHGTLGWTLACGSGEAIADIISQRAPRVVFPFLGG